MRDIFTEVFASEPLDPTEAARRSLRPKNCARGSTSAPRPASGRGRASDAARRQAGAHAGARAAGRAVAGARPGDRRRMGGAARGGRSGAHAADAARQRDHRRRRREARRRSRPRSRNISAPICCSIAPASRKGWSPARRKHWDPVLQWARDALGARFVLAEGVTFVAQPPEAIAAAAQAIPRDPWRLGAVNSATALTGSALLALALAHGRLDVEGLGRGACRRGLEHGEMGPRRAGAGAPRVSGSPKCRRRRRCWSH